MNTYQTEAEKEVVLNMTNRADELLHMLLDLKQGKEDVDLYRMQTLILNMYKDEVELVHIVGELERKLEGKKRNCIDIPKFMFKKKEAQ